MAAADLPRALQATLDNDKKFRDAAEQWLAQFKAADPVNFMACLANELGNAEGIIRSQAAVQLKNCLTGQHDYIRQSDIDSWKAMPAALRLHIRSAALNALQTTETAPQIVKAIAVIEVPADMWPTMTKDLFSLLRNAPPSEMLKINVLKTLGFVTEDICRENPALLKPSAPEILTVVVEFIVADPSNAVKSAAIEALTNSLEFCNDSFNLKDERTVIMQTVYDAATQNKDPTVEIKAMECLVRIAELYYEHLEPYMSALYAATTAAMGSDDPEKVKQGIEFWTSIAEEEITLNEEFEEAQLKRTSVPVSSRQYTLGAHKHLVPLLLKCMTMQEEFEPEDEWTVSKAAAVCLKMLAECCGDAILVESEGFIRNNLRSPEWQCRDAAVMAFGVILDGPDEKYVKTFCSQALLAILALIEDPVVVVKDSTGWVIGRVAEQFPDIVMDDMFLPSVLDALARGLLAEPRVAHNCCVALGELVEAAYHCASSKDDMDDVMFTKLTPSFHAIVDALLKVAARPDATENNLRTAAYDAIRNFMDYYSIDCYPVVQVVAAEILNRLEATYSQDAGGRDQLSKIADLQSSLCSVLQPIFRKLKLGDVLAISERALRVLSALLSSATSDSSSVQEDALLALSALIEGMRVDAAKIIPYIKDFLLKAINNFEHGQTCAVAVGVVADLFRASGQAATPYTHEFANALFLALSQKELDNQVKPQIFSAFGDMALAIGPAIEPILSQIFSLLHSACPYAAPKSTDDVDEDLLDLINDLRESILEAYTGIFQALSGPKGQRTAELEKIIPQVQHVLDFLNQIVPDLTLSDTCVRLSAGLIGDICRAYGKDVQGVLSRPTIELLQQRVVHGASHKTTTMVVWMKQQLDKIMA